MEIYCSKTPNASPIKKAPKTRPTLSLIENGSLEPVELVVDDKTPPDDERSEESGCGSRQSNSGHTTPIKSLSRSHSSRNRFSESSDSSLISHQCTYLIHHDGGNCCCDSEALACAGVNTAAPPRNDHDVQNGTNGHLPMSDCDEEVFRSNYYTRKVPLFSEDLLNTKLKKVAIERECYSNGTNNSSPTSSSLCSHKDSLSNFYSKHNDFSSFSVERFHMSEGSGSMSPYTESVDDEETPSCYGSIIAEDAVLASEIKSPSGTVRGVRNCVRAGIAAFHAVEETESPGYVKKINYAEKERGKIVLYTTTLSVIRSTFERCQLVRQVLHTQMVKYEERDLCMNKDSQRELRERLDLETIVLPWVFLHGRLLGDATRIQEMNESGDLRMLLRPFPKICLRAVCECCGGYRFVPCGFCHGSRKSLIRNHSLQEFVALKCTICNENGLVRCQSCTNVTPD